MMIIRAILRTARQLSLIPRGTTDFTTLTEHQLDNGGYNYEIYRVAADGSDPQTAYGFS